ncbi:MAG: hypothetical protein VKJ06_00675 [Vampirovibrionales bacterium]|nr:hypothetical protein [Vampirovibrionales bacterium]
MLNWLFGSHADAEDRCDIEASLSRYAQAGQTPPGFTRLLKPAMAVMTEEEQSEEAFLGAQLVLMANGLL